MQSMMPQIRSTATKIVTEKNVDDVQIIVFTSGPDQTEHVHAERSIGGQIEVVDEDEAIALLRA